MRAEHRRRNGQPAISTTGIGRRVRLARQAVEVEHGAFGRRHLGRCGGARVVLGIDDRGIPRIVLVEGRAGMAVTLADLLRRVNRMIVIPQLFPGHVVRVNEERCRAGNGFADRCQALGEVSTKVVVRTPACALRRQRQPLQADAEGQHAKHVAQHRPGNRRCESVRRWAWRRVHRRAQC